MTLMWWPLLLVGGAALVAAIVLAWLIPIPARRRRLRPLAHVDRLTRLPEYARVYRAYVLSMVTTLLLVTVTFIVAMIAGARPTGLPASTQAFDAAYPQDTMLCVGEEVTDPATAELFGYFGQQGQTYERQRLGLTSPTLRVIPLTRDHTYVTDRLLGLARLAPIAQRLERGDEVSAAERGELAARTEEFSRPIEYVDYAPSAEDVLALCMSGFPDTEQAGAHRRQLIYVGDSGFGTGNDGRAPAYTADAVQQLAVEKGVQVNVISVVGSDAQDSGALRSVTEATGGSFHLFNPGPDVLDEPGTDPLLAQFLDQIAADPPAARSPDGQLVTSSSWDTPNPVLICGLVAAVLLSASLVVLRR